MRLTHSVIPHRAAPGALPTLLLLLSTRVDHLRTHTHTHTPPTHTTQHAHHPPTPHTHATHAPDHCTRRGSQVPSGSVIVVKPLAALAMIDEGEVDWKVIVINVADERAAQVNSLADVNKVFPGEVDAIREWFTVGCRISNPRLALPAVTCRYVPLRAVTCRVSSPRWPLCAVTRRDSNPGWRGHSVT